MKHNLKQTPNYYFIDLMIQKLQTLFRGTLLFCIAILTLPCEEIQSKQYFILGMTESPKENEDDPTTEFKDPGESYYIADKDISNERLANYVKFLHQNSKEVVKSINVSFFDKNRDQFDEGVYVYRENTDNKKDTFSKVRKQDYYMSKKEIKEFINKQKNKSDSPYQSLIDYTTDEKKVLVPGKSGVVSKTINEVFFPKEPDPEIDNKNNISVRFYKKRGFWLFLFLAGIGLVLVMTKSNSQRHYKKKKTKQKSSL